jgi:hypothetical protein
VPSGVIVEVGVGCDIAKEGLNVEGKIVGRRGEKVVNDLEMLVRCLDERGELPC